MILQFRFFLANDFSLLFALFWLFLAAISGFTYFVTAFINKPQTAVYVGFIVFLVRGTSGVGAGVKVFGQPQASCAPGSGICSSAATAPLQTLTYLSATAVALSCLHPPFPRPAGRSRAL